MSSSGNKPPTDPTEGAKPETREQTLERTLRVIYMQVELPERIRQLVREAIAEPPTPSPSAWVEVMELQPQRKGSGSPASPSGEALWEDVDGAEIVAEWERQEGESMRSGHAATMARLIDAQLTARDSALSSLSGERELAVKEREQAEHSKDRWGHRAARLEHENQELRARAERAERLADAEHVRWGKLEDTERALDSAREALRKEREVLNFLVVAMKMAGCWNATCEAEVASLASAPPAPAPAPPNDALTEARKRGEAQMFVPTGKIEIRKSPAPPDAEVELAPCHACGHLHVSKCRAVRETWMGVEKRYSMMLKCGCEVGVPPAQREDAPTPDPLHIHSPKFKCPACAPAAPDLEGLIRETLAVIDANQGPIEVDAQALRTFASEVARLTREPLEREIKRESWNAQRTDSLWREEVGLREEAERKLAEVTQRLEDVYVKDRLKTREINLLTLENRNQAKTIARLKKKKIGRKP